MKNVICLLSIVYCIPLYAISGKIIDKDNVGIPNASVFFTSNLDPNLVFIARTNESGNYAIDSLGTVAINSPKSKQASYSTGKLLFDNQAKISLNIYHTAKKPALVTIYNLRGDIVRQLESFSHSSGYHSLSWDMKNRDGQSVFPGIYLYAVERQHDRSQHNPYAPSKKTSSNPPAGDYDVYITGKGIFPYRQRTINVKTQEIKNFTVKRTDLWDSNRVVIRSHYYNSLYQFSKGTGRVAFLGGSITSMGAWRVKIQNYLKKTFPQTTFDFIAVGIGSTGSKYHTFRYQRDVLSNGKVDLLFFESAVNDRSKKNGVNDTLRLRSHEGVLRQARLDNPEIDIVQLHFLHAEYYAAYDGVNLIPPFQAYDSAGRHYSSSMQNLAHYCAERYTWEEFGANVHPGEFGATLYANNIIAMFTKAWQDSLPENYQKLAYPIPIIPLDSLSFYRGRFISIDSAYNITGWQKITSRLQDFLSERSALQGTSGSTLTLNFHGRVIGFERGTLVGKIRYDIDDGMHTGIIDPRRQKKPIYAGRAFIIKEDLENKPHVIKLEVVTDSSGGTPNIIFFNFIAN